MADIKTTNHELSKAVNATEPSNWRYIAEGSANLIVAYAPSPSTGRQRSLHNRCLRLRKRARGGPETEKGDLRGQEIHPSNHDEDRDRAEETSNNIDIGSISPLDLHNQVINSLIEPRNLLQFTLVRLNRQWLQELNSLIEPIRPASKRASECIDTDTDEATVMENLTSCETDHADQEILAIEIKPKWSFLPQMPDLLDPMTREVKTKFCRTCVFRAVRSLVPSAHDKIDAGASGSSHHSSPCDAGQLDNYYLSGQRFCSLQLFKLDDPINLREALRRLSNEWQPSGEFAARSRCTQKHNNFKIFRNGVMLDPSSVKLDPQVIEVLALGLEKSGVLERIDHLQRRLDPINIEGIFKSLKKENRDKAPFDDLCKEPFSLTELKAILPLMSTQANTSQFMETFNSLPIRQQIAMYMLSMTFKDCSIFIRLPVNFKLMNSSGSEMIIKPIKNAIQDENFSVKVIDLDFKPVSRLSKYLKTDCHAFQEFKCLLSLTTSQPSSTQSANFQLGKIQPVTCTEICAQNLALS